MEKRVLTGKSKTKLLLVILIMTVFTAILTGCSDDQQNNGKVRDMSKPSKDESVSGSDEYPHDIEKDRTEFDSSNINIVVGDNLYATQINDWHTNPEDYIGQTVEIEGYYVDVEGFSFIGRLGPACPYCKGGYVSFEFNGDQDLSGYKSGKSWIRVQGIIRQGFNSIYGAFPYIEAINVEELPEVGVDTVTN